MKQLLKKVAFILSFCILASMLSNVSFADEGIIVEFDNVGEDGIIYRNEQSEIKVNVLSDEEIERVELIIDNSLFETDKQAPYLFDISALGYGEYNILVKAYSISGASGETPLVLRVAGKVDQVLFTEDFSNVTLPNNHIYENFENGMISEKFQLTSEENIHVRDNPDMDNNPSSKALYIDGSDGSKVSAVCGFDSIPDRYSVSYKIYPDQFYNYYILYAGGYNSGRFVMRNRNFMDDVLKTGLLSESITNKWYNIKIDVDNITQKYAVNIDGEYKGEFDFAGGTSGKDCYFQINANNAGAYYVDDINISVVEEDTEVMIGSGGTIAKENNGYFAITNTGGQNEEALEIDAIDDGTPYVIFPVQGEDANMIIWSANIRCLNANGGIMIKMVDESKNEYMLSDYIDALISAQMQDDECHRVEVEMDKNKMTYSVSIDGKKVCSDMILSGKPEYIGMYLSGNSHAAIDDVTVASREIITQNTPPTIKFLEYEEAVTLPKTDLGMLTVDASDEDGISYVELYIDNSLKSVLYTAPYSVDISDLEPGEHIIKSKAYDVFGKSAETELLIRVTDVLANPVFEQDYNDLEIERASVELKPGDGSTLRGQRGYYMTDIIDAVHKNSLKLGIDETYNADNNSAAMAQYYLSNTITADAIVKFSIYFSDRIDTKAELMRYEGGTFLFSPIGFTEEGNVTIDGTVSEYTYEAGEWYDVEIKVNTEKKLCDVHFDGKTIGRNIRLPETFTSLTHIRLYGPQNENIPSFVGIDDIFVSTIHYTPEIIDIGNGFSVPYDADTIQVTLSEAVYPSSVNAERVIVYDEFGKQIGVWSALCSEDGKTINIRLSQKLNPNSIYEVVLDKGIELIAGSAINVDVSGKFKTTVKDFGIEAVTFSKIDNQTEISVNTVNTLPDMQKIYLIASIWKGDTFCSMECFELELSPLTDETTVINAQKIQEGERMEVYIWDGFTKPVSVVDRIYITE